MRKDILIAAVVGTVLLVGKVGLELSDVRVPAETPKVRKISTPLPPYVDQLLATPNPCREAYEATLRGLREKRIGNLVGEEGDELSSYAHQVVREGGYVRGGHVYTDAGECVGFSK